MRVHKVKVKLKNRLEAKFKVSVRQKNTTIFIEIYLRLLKICPKSETMSLKTEYTTGNKASLQVSNMRMKHTSDLSSTLEALELLRQRFRWTTLEYFDSLIALKVFFKITASQTKKAQEILLHPENVPCYLKLTR